MTEREKMIEAVARVIDPEAFGDVAAKFEATIPITLWPERREIARQRARAAIASIEALPAQSEASERVSNASPETRRGRILASSRGRGGPAMTNKPRGDER